MSFLKDPVSSLSKGEIFEQGYSRTSASTCGAASGTKDLSCVVSSTRGLLLLGREEMPKASFATDSAILSSSDEYSMARDMLLSWALQAGRALSDSSCLGSQTIPIGKGLV